LPEEQEETNGEVELSEEDAAERDRRNQSLREAAERAEFKRRTQVLQRNLPRPSTVDADSLLKNASMMVNPVESVVAKEMALLVLNDALKYPDPDVPTKVTGASRPLEIFDDDELNKARLEIALELPSSGGEERQQLFEESWLKIHNASLLGLTDYSDSESEVEKLLATETVNVSCSIQAIPRCRTCKANLVHPSSIYVPSL
jgi:pre-mRNA-splicing factor CDC5/CEF1